MFKKQFGDWNQYRKLPNHLEVDFHWADYGDRHMSYWEKMSQVEGTTWESLEKAQKDSNKYVIFTHGCSTSHNGKKTARSVVRSIMRSKKATPYIIRKECIQHERVFVAAIRPSMEGEDKGLSKAP